ncbi:hypothetical protein LX15_002975 [Streptoalloteichus tenebrarius]|uniref:DUF7224 domain-containing protein n=1 Tax=Streptoalloteichus tenebrarius (strain ATCC 17920 / DSM 40477 / JCM 4838 / CBS 697.72 / NBRC 16177 / NCIMB 11028 / NRRL B-12390 / A12253. 1 / ISP 5477) TaxID=1933 RepID=A0ABT1HUT4_STRSD|nr:hypothetical protein [Streptoalloteichus tenebrarius]MCP2259274.1 hypothetical protein [Streptoalloteichus tenebrarius]BFE99034.1 hypothetical protein GCM10020241_07100 [Streptoalloteichus tenebrarius]
MSVLRVALLRGSALFGVPVMIVLGIIAGQRGADSWSVDWFWATGQLQQHGVLLVPLTTALAAWDASRNRRLGTALLYRTYPRSPLASALLDATGALLAGLAGWATTFLVMALNVRGGGHPYWSVVLLGAFGFIPAALVGVVAGRYLPRYLAPPVTAALVWLGLAFGSSSTKDVVARLSTVDRQCCDVYTEPVPTTIAGQWLWLAAIGLAAVAVLSWPRLPHLVPGVLGSAAALATALVLISSTGAQLTRPRPPQGEACRTEGEVTVCMWPEHAHDVDAWVAAAATFRARFADLGQLPTLFIENGLRSPSSGAVSIGPVRAYQSPEDLVASLAYSLVPPAPECAAIGNGGYGFFPAATTRSLLNGWIRYRLQATAPSVSLVPPEDVPALDRLRALPADQQAQWYHAVVEAHRDCSTNPPRVP